MEQRQHEPTGRKTPAGHLTYERVTRGIRVLVRPAFLDDQSDPESGRYLWSYTVTIENKSSETVQLVSRLRQEHEAAVEEAAEAKREAARLAEEVKSLQAERKQVRGRIEKLLGQIDQLGAS